MKEKEKKRRKISVIPLVMCSLLSVCVLERNDWSSGTPSRFGAPPQSLDLVHHFNPFTINYSINNNKTKQNKRVGKRMKDDKEEEEVFFYKQPKCLKNI